MTVRGKAAAPEPGGLLGDALARIAELEAMVTIMTRFAAQLAVRVSETRTRDTSASFRDIAVRELHLGVQYHDVDRIERWLTEHGS